MQYQKEKTLVLDKHASVNVGKRARGRPSHAVNAPPSSQIQHSTRVGGRDRLPLAVFMVALAHTQPAEGQSEIAAQLVHPDTYLRQAQGTARHATSPTRPLAPGNSLPPGDNNFGQASGRLKAGIGHACPLPDVTAIGEDFSGLDSSRNRQRGEMQVSGLRASVIVSYPKWPMAELSDKALFVISTGYISPYRKLQG